MTDRQIDRPPYQPTDGHEGPQGSYTSKKISIREIICTKVTMLIVVPGANVKREYVNENRNDERNH